MGELTLKTAAVGKVVMLPTEDLVWNLHRTKDMVLSGSADLSFKFSLEVAKDCNEVLPSSEGFQMQLNAEP